MCLNFPCKRPCPDGLGLAGFCPENTIYQRDRREEQCDAARAATGSEKISKAARHPSVCVCACMVNSMLFATSLLFMRCSPKGLFSPSLPHPAYPLNIVHTREVLIHVNRDRTKGMQMLLSSRPDQTGRQEVTSCYHDRGTHPRRGRGCMNGAKILCHCGNPKLASFPLL